MDTGLELRATWDWRLWVGNGWQVGEGGVADEAVEKPKKLMNLGVGTDPQMPQPQASYPLSHHDTRCPDLGPLLSGVGCVASLRA